jgi:F0F1-type ATP synthase assembly protein I
MRGQNRKDGADARERSLWADLVSMGMVFPIAIVLGWFLGQWVGGVFGRQAAGRLVGLALGVLAGFWELFKVTKRLERYDGGDKKGKENDDNRH